MTTDASAPFPHTLAEFTADPGRLIGRVPGIWLVDKPSGPSSNAAVMRARRALTTKRVGHAGTLDPLASGLLLLLAGNATRLFDHMQNFPKEYRASFRLGERTDSGDVTGNILQETYQVRPPVAPEDLETALHSFRGNIVQTPPMHSALKKNGQPLYKMARRGEVVEREARPMTVYSLELAEFDGRVGVLVMSVSKGFYVRTLVDDLGMLLGCGAVMTALRRTAIGPFRVEEAVALDDLAEYAAACRIRQTAAASGQGEKEETG